MINLNLSILNLPFYNIPRNKNENKKMRHFIKIQKNFLKNNINSFYRMTKIFFYKDSKSFL